MSEQVCSTNRRPGFHIKNGIQVFCYIGYLGLSRECADHQSYNSNLRYTKISRSSLQGNNGQLLSRYYLIHFVKVVLRNFPAIVHNKPLDFIAHSFLAGGAEVDFHPIGRVSDFLHNIGLFCFLYGQRGSVCGGAGFIAHRLSFP